MPTPLYELCSPPITVNWIRTSGENIPLPQYIADGNQSKWYIRCDICDTYFVLPKKGIPRAFDRHKTDSTMIAKCREKASKRANDKAITTENARLSNIIDDVRGAASRYQPSKSTH
jgi:hypothetical protein